MVLVAREVVVEPEIVVEAGTVDFAGGELVEELEFSCFQGLCDL